MSNDDETATALVVDVLRSKQIAALDFTLGAQKITPSMYERVAKAIEAKQITVVVDTKSGTNGVGAGYLSTMKLNEKTTLFNVLVLSRADLGDSIDSRFQQLAHIVHESTHAAFDLLKIRKVTYVHNESAAYVAGAIYMIVKMLGERGNPAKVTVTDPIQSAAWGIAWNIARGLPVSREMTNALAVAISNSDLYKNKATDVVPNDGVGQQWIIDGKRVPTR